MVIIKKLFIVKPMENIEYIFQICDNLCIERLYKNHLQSQTHTNNNRKRRQLK